METFYKSLDEIENGLDILCDKKNYQILSRDEFTGILDKNGDPIYEWDIVRVNMLTDKKVVWLKRQAEIIWQSPWFILDYSRWLPRDIHIWRCPIEWQKDIEVIGNIYENPDLLSPQK